MNFLDVYMRILAVFFVGNLVTKLSEVRGRMEQYFNKKVLMKIGD